VIEKLIAESLQEIINSFGIQVLDKNDKWTAINDEDFRTIGRYFSHKDGTRHTVIFKISQKLIEKEI